VETTAHDLGFSWRLRKDGSVEVLHYGRLAATLRGAGARDFLARAGTGDAADVQKLMARVTGNYKRGNERRAGAHPRNARA
jgi:hypothetical protein